MAPLQDRQTPQLALLLKADHAIPTMFLQAGQTIFRRTAEEELARLRTIVSLTSGVADFVAAPLNTKGWAMSLYVSKGRRPLRIPTSTPETPTVKINPRLLRRRPCM